MFRQQDPTSGTQNIKWVAIGKTMANEPVGTWSDTTTLNVLTDVYFNLDDITANIPMPLDSVTNLSIYNYNTSTYNNVTNPPNTVYFPYWSGDTIRVISYAPGYVTVDRNYIIDNSITEYDEVHGYYYSGYSPGYLNGHSGHAKVNYVQDNPTSDDVLIYGTTLDQYGTKIPNLELWLLDGASNAVIEHTYSNMWGTFGVYVDPTLGRKNYRIMVNYPGYGNLTPIIKYDGGVFNMDNPFYWPDAWTSPNGQGNNNPYSQLNIDTLLSLKYTPSVTVTPTPSNNPPPAGYYEISGKVTDSNGVLTSNIPIYLLYSNGTVSATTTTNTAGAYALYFPTSMTFNIYTLKCGMRTGYDNSTVQNFYSLALPELFQYTPDNNLKLNFMLPVDDYVPNYIIKGRVYDSGTNTGLISAYVTLYDDTNADIAYALTNGAGSYSLTLPDGLAFGTYRVGYAHAGYYEQNLTVVYPNDFGGASSITHDAPMAPIPGGSLSNIIGHVYATNTGVVIQNALVVAKYHANATIVKSAYSDAYGAARIYNIGNGEYDIVVTATGFNSMSWYLNISTQNTYEAQIGLTPVVAPTAYPTIAPTATPSPTSPINALNPIEALISLLMLVGMDRGTAQILLGFILVLLGAFVMAIISQKVALEMNAGYLIAGGAAAGFVAACMIPTSTGTLWPQWLLLIAGILTVVLAVGFFLKQSNTGG
jgi:hypothetical protein